jgi:hypothetical protein
VLQLFGALQLPHVSVVSEQHFKHIHIPNNLVMTVFVRSVDFCCIARGARAPLSYSSFQVRVFNSGFIRFSIESNTVITTSVYATPRL